MQKSASYPAKLGIRVENLTTTLKAKRGSLEFPCSECPSQESKHGFTSSLAVVMKWTKAELRSRFSQGLNPKSWTKITESRFFGPKTTFQSPEEDAQFSSDANRGAKPTPRTTPRAKSDVISQNQDHDQIRRGRSELSPLNEPIETISIRTVVCRTVREASRDPGARYIYAKCAEFDVCAESSDGFSETGSFDKVALTGDDVVPIDAIPDRRETPNIVEEAPKAQDKSASGMTITSANNSPTSSQTNSAGRNTSEAGNFRDCYIPYTKNSYRETSLDDIAPPGSLVDNAIRNRAWGLNRSELILQDHERTPTELPNCTASHQRKKNWRITNSMLSAYTAMRGPYRLAGRDIFVWMDRCGKTFRPPDECNEHFGSCRTAISNLEPLSYDPPLVDDEPSQTCVFSVPRPPYEHIKPPVGFSREEHMEPTTEVPQDIIRDMKQETELWGGDKNGNDLKSIGMSNPNFVAGNEHACDAFDWKLEEIRAAKYHALAECGFDMDDQLEFSTNSGESSLEYIAIGYNENTLPNRLKEWTKGQQIDAPCSPTMTQVAEQALTTRPIMPAAEPAPSCDLKPYTESEIIAALNAADARSLDGIPSCEAEEVLRERYKSLQMCLEAEKNAALGIAETEKRIHMREAQLERVSVSVHALLEKKASKTNRRREEIYRHVSQNLREIKETTKSKQEQTWELAVHMANLMAKEKQIEVMLMEEARRVGVEGLSDPDDIEQVVRQMLVDEEEYAGDDEESFF